MNLSPTSERVGQRTSKSVMVHPSPKIYDYTDVQQTSSRLYIAVHCLFVED